jgi:Stage II sporulation protein E (SpoIIE)
MQTMPPSRLRIHICVIALLLLGAATTARAEQPPAPSTTLTIPGVGRGLVPINGKWQFHTGDDLAWASTTFDDSAWEQIGVDRGWGAQGHYAYTGYGWYRRHIDFLPVAGVHQNLALMIPPVYGPYEVYWNGVRIGQVGRMPPNPRGGFRPPPSSFGLGTGGAGVLAIRMWYPPLHFEDAGDEGGIFRVPLVGSADAVRACLGDLDHTWLKNRQFYFDINLLYGLVAASGLIFWLRNRSQKLLFWVSLFALSQPLHTLLFNAHVPFPYTFAFGFNRPVDALKEISLWYLLLYLLDLDSDVQLRRWTRILAWFGAMCSVLAWLITSLDWSSSHAGLYQIADGLLAFPISIIEAFPLVIIYHARHKKLPLANWLVAGTALLLEMIGVIAVTSLQGLRFTHWHSVYDTMRYHLFTINGNYFDPENIATTLLLIALLYAVYRYSIDQKDRQNTLEQEFLSAQEVQRILIPETLPPLPGFAITSAYLPAQQVGGDFFQVIAQPDGSALIVVGDVSGKGLKAAMSVSLIIGSLRAIADTSGRPAEILSHLNRRLYGRLQDGFATCLVVRLEPGGECIVANAGHLSPFVNYNELDLAPALPLGIVAAADFEEVHAQLEVGDRLTLYTDGLLEARNASGELYGFDRTRDLIATCPDAHQATEVAVAFGQDDDITVLIIKRLAVGVESTTSLVAPTLVSIPA